MNHNDTSIASLLSEYETLVAEVNACRHEVDWDGLRASLVTSCDWSSRGADHLVLLAKEYGSFVLRNACALSLALGIEDGELGI